MEHFICPISQQIMKDPVMARDGHIYEREEIDRWFKTNDTSPLTREKTRKTLMPVIPLRSLIEEYIKENPDKKEEQYGVIKEFSKHTMECLKAAEKKDWDTFMKFNNFDVQELRKATFSFRDYPVDVLKHIMNNCDRKIEFSRMVSDFPVEFVDYLVDRPDFDIHKGLILHDILGQLGSKGEDNQKIALVTKLVDKGVNVDKVDQYKMSALHNVCMHGPYELVPYLAERMKNCDNVNWEGETPFYCLCRFSSKPPIEIIKYFLSKNVDLWSSDYSKPFNGLLDQHNRKKYVQVFKNFPDNEKKATEICSLDKKYLYQIVLGLLEEQTKN